MVLITFNKKKKHFICMISILMVSLLISGTALPVYADTADQLDQWYVRHDPELSIATEYELCGITYGNGKFVAVGDCYNSNYYDPILTSTDGTNWEEQVSGVKGLISSLNAVTFGGGKFVAVGMGGLILTSPDGVIWAAKNEYDSGESSLLAVAYGNDTFVATGVSGTIWTSADGENWLKSTPSPAYDIRGITYGKGTFVMIGNYGYIWTSTDGASWQVQDSGFEHDPNSPDLSAVSFGNGIFTAVGQDGTILTSTDGVHWEDHSVGSAAGILVDAAFGSGMFVTVSGNGAVLTSTDGADWTQQNTNITGDFSGVAYGNYTFCIVGGSLIYQSENLGPVVSGINPSSGPEAGGTEVTVTGSNLSGATAVYFGNVKSDLYTINADTSITAVAPPGAGAVPVRVWGQDGASAAASNNLFTYIPQAPAISGQPSGQAVGAGQTATFTVEAVGEAPLSYQWKKGGNDLSDGGNISGASCAVLSISNAQDADEGSYTCYVSNDSGNTTSDVAELTVIGEGEPPTGSWSDYTRTPGLSGSTYTIDSSEELAWLASEINQGHNLSSYTFNVVSDIDLSVHYWTPIGITETYPFKSHFNGGGHTITGMTVGSEPSPSPYEFNGLFGVSGSSAQIENIKIADVSVSACSGAAAGGLIGYHQGAIDNCFVTGTVEGGMEAFIGGLAGYNEGSISDSQADCTVNGGDGSYIGGFAGSSEGNILNSRAKCTVNGGAGCSIGGFVGDSYTLSDTISNCYATGNVTGGGDTDEYDSWIGGFAGYNMSLISNCYASCNVTGGTGSTVGGFIGFNQYPNLVSAYWNSSAVQTVNGSVREVNLGLGSGTDKTIGKTEDVMKSQTFTSDLNTGIGSLPAGPEYLLWISDRCDINGGYPIFITDMTPPEINPAAVGYILNDPDDVSTEIIWNSAQSVTGVEFGAGSLTEGDEYIISNDTLTINKEFLSGLYMVENDTAVFEISFDLGDSVLLTVKAGSLNSGDGGHGGSGGGTPNIGSGNYSASVSGNGITQSSLPITVNGGTESAAVDLRTLSDSLFTGGEETVIRVPSIPGVNSYTMEIPAASLLDSRGEGTLTFSSALGSLTISGGMLTGIPGIEGKEASITIGQGDKDDLSEDAKAIIGDRPLIQLTLKVNGSQTEWNNPETPVTVSIPYTPTAAELQHPENIVVWYIDGSGNAVPVPNGHYNPETGTVTFATTHFSFYAVGFNPISFSDIPAGKWYSKAVNFIAAREITTGTGNGSYQPKATLTRGAFLVMMMRAYGIGPDTTPADNFADAGSKYYTNYLSAAKRLGISGGIGNNLFAPDKEITRQEMFTLQYNMLKKINRLPADNSGKQLADFSDAGQIASWAKDAAAFLTEAGVISGNNGKISPEGTVTRAEMAQALYNLLSK